MSAAVLPTVPDIEKDRPDGQSRILQVANAPGGFLCYTALSTRADSPTADFRQEALNNVVKHAQASRVEVRLRCLDGDHPDLDLTRIELRIADDGRGFDPADVPPDRLGLGIIRERAQAIDASLEIESRPGRGTRITVVWKEET